MKLVLSDDDVNKSLDDAANGDEVTSSENTSTEVQGTYGLTCLTTIDNKGYQKTHVWPRHKRLHKFGRVSREKVNKISKSKSNHFLNK